MLFRVTVDGGMGQGHIMPKVYHATNESADWAEDVVAATGMSNLLTTFGIFLIRELKNAESSSEKLVVSRSHKVKLAGP